MHARHMMRLRRPTEMVDGWKLIGANQREILMVAMHALHRRLVSPQTAKRSRPCGITYINQDRTVHTRLFLPPSIKSTLGP